MTRPSWDDDPAGRRAKARDTTGDAGRRAADDRWGWLAVAGEGCGCCFFVLLAPLFGLIGLGVIMLAW